MCFSWKGYCLSACPFFCVSCLPFALFLSICLSVSLSRILPVELGVRLRECHQLKKLRLRAAHHRVNITISAVSMPSQDMFAISGKDESLGGCGRVASAGSCPKEDRTSLCSCDRHEEPLEFRIFCVLNLPTSRWKWVWVLGVRVSGSRIRPTTRHKSLCTMNANLFEFRRFRVPSSH